MSAKRRHRRERARAAAVGASNGRIVSDRVTDEEIVAKPPLPGIRLTEPGELNANALRMSPTRFEQQTGITPAEFRAAAALSDDEAADRADRLERLIGMPMREARRVAALPAEDYEAYLREHLVAKTLRDGIALFARLGAPPALIDNLIASIKVEVPILDAAE